MLHHLAVSIPNFLPDWHFFRPAGRLIWSTLILVVGIGVIQHLCKQPKPKEPSTWAQAMFGAVISFGLMLLAYGTVPHEWLTFANGYLKWDTTHFLVQGRLVGESSLLSNGHWFLPINVPLAAIKDIVATGIYVVLVTLNCKLFVKWQKRPAAPIVDAAAAPDVSTGTSAYGKPLTAKA